MFYQAYMRSNDLKSPVRPKGRQEASTAAAWRIMSLHLSGTSCFPEYTARRRLQQMVMAQYNWISLSWFSDGDTICHLLYYPLNVLRVWLGQFTPDILNCSHTRLQIFLKWPPDSQVPSLMPVRPCYYSSNPPVPLLQYPPLPHHSTSQSCSIIFRMPKKNIWQ